MGGSAENRAQLGGEQCGVLFINAHCTVAKERVVLCRNVEVIHRLIAADVHGTDNNATPFGGLQRLAENVIQLAFARFTGSVHIEHFGAEQADGLRAIAKGRLCFNGVGNVGGNFQTNAVGGARFFT